MDALGKLEQRQIHILQRITALELSLQTQHLSSLSLASSASGGRAETTESRLSAILVSLGASDFVFRRVASDYYDRSLEERRDIVGAASVHHLCKSIVLGSSFGSRIFYIFGEKVAHISTILRRCISRSLVVNTQAPASVVDCSDRNNSKYYAVVIQYTARLNAESIKNFLYTLNNKMVAKKKFNMRLAPEEDSLALTGFVHNAVTCIGMKTDIPVILDEAIVKLNPDYFWLGGGEVDLKLGIRTPEFINAIKPFVVSCSS